MTAPPWYVGLMDARDGEGEYDAGDGEEDGVYPTEGDGEGEMWDAATQAFAALDHSCTVQGGTPTSNATRATRKKNARDATQTHARLLQTMTRTYSLHCVLLAVTKGRDGHVTVAEVTNRFGGSRLPAI